MEIGSFVGKGKTAEVYKWEKDKVLKLFLKKYDLERVLYEAEIGRAVHRAAAPAPAVYDIIVVDGRYGIQFQRIFGNSMSSHIQKEPWKIYYFAKQLARLHYNIHKCTSDELPAQNERLSLVIEKSSRRLGEKKKSILEYLDCLPGGTSVCHGDLHFNNVIVSDKGLVAVDWNSAYIGNPLGDVARTYLMMNSPLVQPGIPKIIMRLSRLSKRLASRIYLAEYMKLANVRYDKINEWILPIAAAKLKDRAPGNDKWLINIINKRYSQLDISR